MSFVFLSSFSVLVNFQSWKYSLMQKHYANLSSRIQCFAVIFIFQSTYFRWNSFAKCLKCVMTSRCIGFVGKTLTQWFCASSTDAGKPISNTNLFMKITKFSKHLWKMRKKNLVTGSNVRFRPNKKNMCKSIEENERKKKYEKNIHYSMLNVNVYPIVLANIHIT